MITKEIFSCICSGVSLLAIITVYTGLLTEKWPVVVIGQLIGVLDLILCAAFFFLYL